MTCVMGILQAGVLAGSSKQAVSGAQVGDGGGLDQDEEAGPWR